MTPFEDCQEDAEILAARKRDLERPAKNERGQARDTYLAMDFLHTREPKPSRPAARSVRVDGSGNALGIALFNPPMKANVLLKAIGGGAEVAGKKE